MGKWKINLKKCKNKDLSPFKTRSVPNLWKFMFRKKGTDLVLSFFQKKFHCQIKDAIISD